MSGRELQDGDDDNDTQRELLPPRGRRHRRRRPNAAALSDDEAAEEDDDENDHFASSQQFEQLVQAKLDGVTSDSGLYLARTVAPVLTKALAEVLLRRPADPIEFISSWLQDNKHHRL